ncbi:phosphoribosyltransferase family protein [Campylobacter sp. VBCF_06 NA8]|uniref:phosphoribosyltransferase family protein n=1 Tax=Campylobacter sp. VBCF_06 NA8 TaxID=2983822 RepID=UPI0022E99AFC|nr:phosphoribosyltransferase family protein [Campylobacter sp. VBCF_06 NA8]MDA3045759.1 phosphoribosyltransferase family protein [Campylobacter sp. VBCF_06 NA8]
MIPRAELMFENEVEAAEKLAEILPSNAVKNENFLIIAQSLSSIYLVKRLSEKLNLSYEFLFSEMIYAPNNPECVIACVSETQEIVFINELVKSFGISLDYIYGQANRKYEEKILKNVYKFRKGALLPDLARKNVILVDEGCESGLTTMTCIKTLIKLNAKTIFYATPVISTDNAQEIEAAVDGLYAVHKIKDFVNVDFYYKEKKEEKAEDIMQILNNCEFYLPFHKEKNIDKNENKESNNAVQD